MSARRGDCQRKRPQKYQNTTSFKNDRYDKSDRIKSLNSMSINEVCQRCHDTIQWKIKYRKYKALTQPGSCNNCHERKVKKGELDPVDLRLMFHEFFLLAYHVLCRDCAMSLKQCAKCLKTEEEVQIIPPGPTPEEQLRLNIEMKAMIKNLPERKRRTFLRFMKGKKNRKNKDGDDEDEGGSEDEMPKVRTRDELLEKFEKLKGADDEFYAGVADGEDDDDSWDSDDYLSDEDEPEK